jgi:hypothetical protein
MCSTHVSLIVREINELLFALTFPTQDAFAELVSALSMFYNNKMDCIKIPQVNNKKKNMSPDGKKFH